MTALSGKSKASLWRMARRAFASIRLTIWLLAVIVLLTFIGTLVPQLPPAADQATRLLWLDLAKHKYGSLYSLMHSLQLFELFRSPVFLGLLALLLVNTTLCTVNRLHVLGSVIQRQHIKSLGTIITHLAVIALLSSAAISQVCSWQETTVPLATGQTYTPSHAKHITLCNEGLNIQYDARGQPIDYAAQVTVFKNDRQIRASTIRLNAPLRVPGTSIWLISYDPAVRVQVRNQQGEVLTLQSNADEQSKGQITLNLSNGQASLHVPSENLELRISKTAEYGAEQAFYLQVLCGDAARPILTETIRAGQEISMANITVTLYGDQYVIYRLKSDPGAVPTLLSALALVLGTSFSLFAARESDK